MKHTKLTTLLASLAFGALVSTTQAQVIFEDDFESGNLNKWTITPTAYNGGSNPFGISTGTNSFPVGGNTSAYMDISADRMHANLVGGSTNSQRFTSYIFETMGVGNRLFNEVRSYAGGSFNNGGLAQLLAIGKLNNVSPTTFPDVYNGGLYQGRVANGPAGSNGWFNLDRAGVPGRSAGWHKFDIEVGRNSDGTQTIRYYVDDVLGRELIGAYPQVAWNTVVMGPGLGTTTGDGWVDGIKVISGQPYISQNPSNQTVNVGQTLTVSAQVVGLATLTYQWKKNGVNVPGGTAVPLVINNAQTSDSGTYTLVAVNSVGTATSTPAEITVNPLIVISKNPAPITVNVGENVAFTVVSDITGNSPLAYQWRKNGVNIPGATGTSYTISNLQAANTGAYSVWDGSTSRSQSNVEQLNVNIAPVIAAQNRTVAPNATLRYVLPVTDDYSVQATPFETFDSFKSGATRIMFNNPYFSSATTNNIKTNNYFPLGVLTNSLPAGNGSSNAFYVKVEYTDNSSWAWIRLTTASGGGGVTNRGNPVISFTQSLRFDVYTDRPLGVALGVRETNTDNPFGANGGGAGSIEYVGASDPAPTPTRYVEPLAWTTLQFNPPTEGVWAYPGSGNGVLASNTGKGALEHLALVWGDLNEFQYNYNIYLDNFVVVPTNSLTFALDNGPSGAKIDEVTGAITWPAPGSIGTTETFTVRVTDTLGLVTTSSFTVTVSDAVPEPGSLSISKNGSGQVVITWAGNFVLQSKSTITGTWADTAITSGQAITPAGQSAFYRLRN